MMYKSFYGYIMGIILRYTKNMADGEELVNDTFIKIFKHVEHFKAPTNPLALQKSFKGWVAQIASRTAIDNIRRTKIQFYVDDLGEEELKNEPVNIASNLEVDDILNLLNYLPELQRLVFNLYEIEGFSHEEIANMLNIPESSSRVYLTRSKNKLRSLYLNTLVNS